MGLADVHSRTRCTEESYDGWTPLHAACYNNQSEIAAELISIGADIEARTTTGKTALMLAKLMRDHKTTALLLKLGAKSSSTFLECFNFEWN